MSDWYTLDKEHNIVGPIDPVVSERLPFEKCIVAKTQLPDCEVSTVFLRLNHGFPRYDGPRPILFETLVFGGPFADECERYATWVEAEAGHARMVDKCQPIMTEGGE